MKRAPEVRIIQINPFKAFSSGLDTIDNVMGSFQQWQEEHSHLVKKLIPTNQIKAALGYHQPDIYVPIKVRRK